MGTKLDDRHFNPRSDERSDGAVNRLSCQLSPISIHAPTNGATAAALSSPVRSPNFNPRSDERSDFKHIALLVPVSISIHAPTNGATTFTFCFLQLVLFQSTLRRTERHILACIKSMCVHFNPRSDERSDLLGLRYGRVITSHFNPRSDERSDGLCNVRLCLLSSISIHAPTNGATPSVYICPSSRYISIHAPTNGATAILHKKMKKTIQNRLIILLFSTNSLRLLCSCTQYSFFLFIFHGANDLVILCSLSFRTTSKN